MIQTWKQRCFRSLTMFSLILAGETIFLPAFHLGRYFKSSLLITFQLDEFQLGQLGAIYGIFATASYFLGGPLADRWSPRKLLASSLVLTAAGSLYMASMPGFLGLKFLFGYWGITTILGFWAPLIRATRDWAGHDGQGRAFGVLDGGRGLASALIASAAAYAFGVMVGSGAEPNPVAEAAAVQRLIYSYAAYCIVAAAFAWCFVPDPQPERDDTETPSLSRGSTAKLLKVLGLPAIWLQAVVIIAAYSAFKMIDNYGIYAEDAYGLTRTQSARLIANISYMRVGAAIAAGWIADRALGTRATIQLCFGLLIASYALFLTVTPEPHLVWLLTVNLVISCTAFFALRGIYFALLEDSGVPREVTGTAVGVISFVGYAPEIFMGPLTGWLIKEARASGNALLGYYQIFSILLALSLCGMLAAFALRWFGNEGTEIVRDGMPE